MAFNLPSSPSTGDTYDFMGKRFTFDGAAWRGSFGVGSLINIQVFTADGTYTPTPGMEYCIVECVGGGGGGGGCAAGGTDDWIGSSGGGGGGYSRSLLTAATIGASQAVDIGAGGSGGVGGTATAGTNGADTTLGTTLVVAKGGTGAGHATSAYTGVPTPGAGGVAGTGNIFTVAGKDGQLGFYWNNLSVEQQVAGGGYGGDSFFGPGGKCAFTTNGSAGVYGGGGGAGSDYNAGGAKNGGAGGAGLMIIHEFTKSGLPYSPIASTDNAVARYNGTTGQLQDSGVTIDDSNILSASSLRVTANSNTFFNYLTLDNNSAGTAAFGHIDFANDTGSVNAYVGLAGSGYTGLSGLGQNRMVLGANSNTAGLLIVAESSSDPIVLASGASNPIQVLGGVFGPISNDDCDLGSATAAWSDLYLSEGSVINWDNGDLLLTQTGNDLGLTGGGLVVGVTTRVAHQSYVDFDVAGLIQSHSTQSDQFFGARYSNNVNGGHIAIGKSRNAGVGSHTVVNNGDELGAVSFQGSDGTEFKLAAVIVGKCDGTPGTDDMPGALHFQTTPDGSNTPQTKLSIHSDGGLRFPATQLASTNANTLDDYEEGTFTPGFTANNSATNVAISAQVGNYVKIGRQVSTWGRITLTNNGTGSGTARITAFPFTASSDAANAANMGSGWLFAGGSAATGLKPDIEGNSTGAVMLIPGAAADAVATDTNCTNSFDYLFYISYLV